jgi:hypothetical protein
VIFRNRAPGADGQVIRRTRMSPAMALAWCLITLPLPTLALVALLRARREDIPQVVEALARWWRRRR